MQSFGQIVLFLTIIGTQLMGAPEIFAGMNTPQDKQHLRSCEVKKMISDDGPKETVNALYNNRNIWEELLNRISSGQREWLEVAVSLKPASDAGTSEMLNSAVGNALEHAPDVVLEITTHEYSLDDICSGPDVDDMSYSTYDKAVTAVRHRIYALKKINNNKLNFRTLHLRCKHLINKIINCILESKEGIVV